MDVPMKGQTALVTGSARGIGKGIALALAKKGVNVVISDINFEEAKAAAAEIEAVGVKALPLKFDVSNSAEVTSAFAQISEAMGRLDILVNNAGITRDALIMRMKDEDWDAVININLKSVFLCTKEAVKLMSKQRYGRIANIASVVAFMGNAGQCNYSASKAGIIGLTKTTAKEYAKRGITANAVAPGFIKTAMTDSLPEKVKEDMLAAIPIGQFGEIEDVANAVAFLVSPEARYITGNVIHVNGGMYM
ncbi:3-oxoacyl-[acyl-carrier-protein] reductase [Candidatus Magnetominusculus dajiuhuensis]|uniref:3-oxoacyl-[acyl-carrier-protein] reductase n=1 Tax=Candidatus Magnetominusculus dajiuhuensis TaxID=3137712 RepID=UPI003B42FFC6